MMVERQNKEPIVTDNADDKILADKHNVTVKGGRGRKKESPKPRCIGTMSMQEEVLSED